MLRTIKKSPYIFIVALCLQCVAMDFSDAKTAERTEEKLNSFRGMLKNSPFDEAKGDRAELDSAKSARKNIDLQVKQLISVMKENHSEEDALSIARSMDLQAINQLDMATLSWIAAFKGFKKFRNIFHDAGLSNKYYATDQRMLQRSIDAVICGGHAWVVRVLTEPGNSSEIEENVDSPLHHAVSELDVNLVDSLLASGVNLHQQSSSGRTALHVAVERRGIVIVHMLLKAGIKIDIADEKGRTAFFVSVSLGHQEIAQLLINAGADVKKKSHAGVSPVMAAVEGEFTQVIKLLKVEAEALDDDQCNTLHRAVLKQPESKVKALLASGVNPDVKSARRVTALQLAVQKGRKEIVRMLLEAGGNPHISIRDLTPLITAIMLGEEQISAMLASAEMKMKAGLHSGMEELFRSVENKDLWFVKRYVNAKLGLDGVDSNKLTVLHGAVGLGLTDITVVLVEAGIKLNAVDEKGRTPLIYAAALGHNNIAKILIEADADLGIFGDGWTALHHAAAKGGMEEIVRLLLSKGVNPNLVTKTKSKTTPLYTAVYRGHFKTVECLLEGRANVNLFCETAEESLAGVSETVLHCAAREGDEAIIRLLIRFGADVNILRREESKYYHDEHWYRSPLTEAVEYGKFEAVKCLLEAGAVLKQSLLQRFDASKVMTSNYLKIMKDIELSLLTLLKTKEHGKKLCNCTAVMKILIEKGVSIAPIKQALLAHIRKKQRPSALDSVIMFQLIGPNFHKK